MVKWVVCKDGVVEKLDIYILNMIFIVHLCCQLYFLADIWDYHSVSYLHFQLCGQAIKNVSY